MVFNVVVVVMLLVKRAETACQIFEHTNYGGSSRSTSGSLSWGVGNSFDDKASSAIVPNGYRFKLYDYSSHLGSSVTLSPGCYPTLPGLHDDVGSVKCEASSEVCGGSNLCIASGCNLCTECGVGIGASRLCTSSQNTLCSPCGPGVFSAAVDTNACAACRGCPLGFGEATPCRADADRTCTECVTGYSATTDGSPCSACPANSHVLDARSTAITDCKCNVGYSGPDGGPCGLCPIGTYKDVVGSASCTPCTNHSSTNDNGATDESECLCLTGYEPASDGTCGPCPVGFYKNTMGGACVSCGSEQTTAGVASKAEGECTCVEGFQPLSFAPLVCESCLGGRRSPERQGAYKDEVSNEPCQPCPGASTYIGTIVATSPQNCSACLSGHFGKNCSACPECEDGYCLEGVDGLGECSCSLDTGLHGLLCEKCDAFQFWGDRCDLRCNCQRGTCSTGFSGTGECTVCDEINYALPLCDECAPGYGPSFAAECQECVEGYGRHPEDARRCIPCDTGSVSNVVSRDLCQPCSPGTYQRDGDFFTCQTCPIGAYQESVGMTGCDYCGAGRTTAGRGSPLAVDCFDCPLNYWKNSTGAGPCLPCSRQRLTMLEGTVSDDMCGCLPGFYAGLVQCLPCAPGTIKLLFGDQECTRCPRGTFFQASDVECIECPLGGVCSGGADTPFPNSGWTEDPNAEDGKPGFVACDPPDVCRFGGTCLLGHEGDRCASCWQGWFKDVRSGICYQCPQSVALILVILMLVALIGCMIMVYFARGKTIYFSALQIGFNFLQIVGLLASFSIVYPPFVFQFLNGMSAVNIDLQLFRPECMVTEPKEAYVSVWLFKMALPGIFVGLLTFLYSIVAVYRQLSEAMSCLPTIAQGELQNVKRAFINAALTVLSLLYLMITATALEVFPCKTLDDGSEVLIREPLIACKGMPYVGLVGVASLFLAMYCIGFPILIGYILYARRHNMWKKKNIVRYGLLFLRYRVQWYLWEVAVILRKFAIIAGRTLFVSTPVMQVIVAVATIFLSAVFQLRVAPYRAGRLNRLEIFHLSSGLIILSLALVFAATQEAVEPVLDLNANNTLDLLFRPGDEDISEEEARADVETSEPFRLGLGETEANAVGGLLIVVVLINVVAMFVLIMFEIYHRYRLSVRGVPDLFATRVDVTNDFFTFDFAVDNFSEGVPIAGPMDERKDKGLAFDVRLSSVSGISMKAQVAQLTAYPKEKPRRSHMLQDATRSFIRSIRSSDGYAHLYTTEVEDVEGGAAHLASLHLAKPGNYEVTFFAAAEGKGKQRSILSRSWERLAVATHGYWHESLEDDVQSGQLRPVLVVYFTVAPRWADEANDEDETVRVNDDAFDDDNDDDDDDYSDGGEGEPPQEVSEIVAPASETGKAVLPTPGDSSQSDGGSSAADADTNTAPTLQCQFCEDYKATLNCRACEMVYCDPCSSTVHRKGIKKRHPLVPLAEIKPRGLNTHLLCGFCEDARATSFCDDCSMHFCRSCCNRRHRKGKMISHKVQRVGRKVRSSRRSSRSTVQPSGDLPLVDLSVGSMNQSFTMEEKLEDDDEAVEMSLVG